MTTKSPAQLADELRIDLSGVINQQASYLTRSYTMHWVRDATDRLSGVMFAVALLRDDDLQDRTDEDSLRQCVRDLRIAATAFSAAGAAEMGAGVTSLRIAIAGQLEQLMVDPAAVSV